MNFKFIIVLYRDNPKPVKYKGTIIHFKPVKYKMRKDFKN